MIEEEKKPVAALAAANAEAAADTAAAEAAAAKGKENRYERGRTEQNLSL